MTRRDPRFCCDYFYTSTSRYTMTVITATTTVKLLCKGPFKYDVRNFFLGFLSPLCPIVTYRLTQPPFMFV